MLQGKATELKKKYGTTAFMYTEYPHKRFWSPGFKPVFNDSDTPTMLYVHIPYCQQLCYFCTCHIEITQDYNKVQTYLDLLYKEMSLIKDYKINYKEVHLGGGSPTILNKEEFDELIYNLRKLTDTDLLDEFSIEIDPRRVSQAEMLHYAANGISRVSFGVQDFDERVQEAVNRYQPARLIEDLIIPEIRDKFANGVNFDIICGLPHQTVKTITNTCEEIVRLRPDRICFNYLHYSPEACQHQRLMKDLPGFEQRKELFRTALNVLTDGGYERTGYDHFALPTDANAVATKEGSVRWNSLGTNAGRVLDTIGIGVSSISSIGNAQAGTISQRDGAPSATFYYQNFYELADYKKALDENVLPIQRGHRLSNDEVLRRDIIQDLRNYFEADVKLANYFAKELKSLKQFEKDGIVVLNGTTVTIIEPDYANLVCRVFDKYYSGLRTTPDLGERNVS